MSVLSKGSSKKDDGAHVGAMMSEEEDIVSSEGIVNGVLKRDRGCSFDFELLSMIRTLLFAIMEDIVIDCKFCFVSIFVKFQFFQSHQVFFVGGNIPERYSFSRVIQSSLSVRRCGT